jgi:hypothetical protein
MRAWLKALEDKSLPSLVADAGEVAGDNSLLYKILLGNQCRAGKNNVGWTLRKYL